MNKLEKKDMEVGKRYKGYGVLNEYGQFEFTPCKKIDDSSRMKIVKSGADYTIYESKNVFRLSFTFPKGSSMIDTVQKFIDATTRACVELRNYL